ncbi:MAG: 5-formyltetrahydrofolate cyclo-ligase [Oscillibacter sp.]|nr:5-formyltetrahydrofolate cyclo-ligase [Oscillibacter sp.]
MTIAEEKRALRKKLRAMEKSLSPDYRERSERAVVAALSSMEAYRNAESVCCFVGTGAEIDTRPFLQDALSSGKRLCVPLCAGRGVMQMRRVRSLDDLSPGAAGIPEPPPDAETAPPSAIDFLVVPCLACDRRGNRLGRGGGYYDRFLPEYGGAAVLICREALLQDSVPTETFDLRVPLVLSERGFYRDGRLTTWALFEK